MFKVMQVNSCYTKMGIIRDIQIRTILNTSLLLILDSAFRRQTAGGRGLEEGKKKRLFRDVSLLQSCHEFLKTPLL